MNPVLKYRGGKSREIPNFEQYIPNAYNRYIEPFFGGGALFFHLEPENAIINDLNTRLMSFYEELRNNYDDMRVELDKLQDVYEKNQEEYTLLKQEKPDKRVPNNNEDLYYLMRDEFNNPTGEYMNSVIYYFINKTAYAGMTRYNRSGEYNVPYGRYPNFNTKLVTSEHSQLLKQANLYNVDYSEIFEMVEADDFVFLDPPYDCIFTDYGNIDAMDEFAEEQHRQLAQDFIALPCPTLMIIGETDLTRELYDGYIATKYSKNYSVNIRNRFEANAYHMIVTNNI